MSTKHPVPIIRALFYTTVSGFFAAATTVNQFALHGSTKTDSWQIGVLLSVFVFALSYSIFYHRNYRINLRDETTTSRTKTTLLIELSLITILTITMIIFAYFLSHNWISSLQESEFYIWSCNIILTLIAFKHVFFWIKSLCLRKRKILFKI
jgi:hypothetical protein